MPDFNGAAEPVTSTEAKTSAPHATPVSEIVQERSGSGTVLAVLMLTFAAAIGGLYMYTYSDSARRGDTPLLRDPVTSKSSIVVSPTPNVSPAASTAPQSAPSAR